MLDFQLSILPHPTYPQQVVVRDATVYGGTNPAQYTQAIMLAAEYLHPGQATGELLDVGRYSLVTLLRPDANPLTLTLKRDGILRFVAVLVTLVPANALPGAYPVAGSAYHVAGTNEVRIRATGIPSKDEVLTPDVLLDQAGELPNVLGITSAFYRYAGKLYAALARLNVRYLALSRPQQQALRDLYERASLLEKGTQYLFEQNRYLDAAAVLLGAERLLVTGGQTPDDFAPLLGGFSPNAGF